LRSIFFLILYEMGMDDKDVRRIMGITQEAICSTRYRILTPKGMSVAHNQWLFSEIGQLSFRNVIGETNSRIRTFKIEMHNLS